MCTPHASPHPSTGGHSPGSLRITLRNAGPRPDLQELIAALEDEKRAVDPFAVVSLERSLLASAPVDELRSRLRALLEGAER